MMMLLCVGGVQGQGKGMDDARSDRPDAWRDRSDRPDAWFDRRDRRDARPSRRDYDALRRMDRLDRPDRDRMNRADRDRMNRADRDRMTRADRDRMTRADRDRRDRPRGDRGRFDRDRMDHGRAGRGDMAPRRSPGQPPRTSIRCDKEWQRLWNGCHVRVLTIGKIAICEADGDRILQADEVFLLPNGYYKIRNGAFWYVCEADGDRIFEIWGDEVTLMEGGIFRCLRAGTYHYYDAAGNERK